MDLQKSLIHRINENTKNSTDFYDFAEPYKVFGKLKIQGKIELEEVDFYSGYKNVGLQIIPREYSSNMEEYEPNTSELEWHLQEQRQSKVRLGTELEELLNNFSSGHICLTGPAGIGKTTLMKSIAREVLDSRYEGLKGIELVHFLQCRHFQPHGLVTVGELLFASAEVSGEDMKALVDFVIAQPHKILFVFDSLDTLPYTVDGIYKYINVDELACPEAILFNFLSGILLPGCRIITSSREHSILNYMGEIRPQKVVALRGFNKDTIKQVMEGYVGDEAEELFRHLENEMPNILALCTTPVTLVYTLIGLRANSDLKPTSTTAILIIVLQSIIRSQHTRLTSEEVLQVMLKLEELSHVGNMEGVVYFTREYFKKVSLQPEKATDLAIMAPAGVPQKIMQGDSILFFSHQTFQEMFGALWVAGSNEKFFKDFLDSINQPRFAVIRRYLYGVTLDCTVHDAICEDLLPADDNYEMKVKLLKENLRSQLLSGITLAPMLELFISMNEANDGIDDVIRSCLPKIDMQGIPLSTTDIFCIGSVVSRCEHLDCLNLRHCSLDSSLIKILDTAVKGSPLQILRLHFGGNPNLGLEGVSAAGEIAQHCKSEEFDMDDCNLSGGEMEILARKEIAKMFVLNLSWNKNFGISGIRAAGEMSARWNVEDLQLRGCNLSGEQLQVLAYAIGAAKLLKKLRLGGNRNLGVDGVLAAGQIVSNCHSEDLDLSGCDLSSEQIHALAVSTEKAEELCVVNLTDKKDATSEDIRSVAKLLPNVKDSIQLEWWKISERDVRYLQSMINNRGEMAPKVILSNKELEWQATGPLSVPGIPKTDDEIWTDEGMPENPSISLDEKIRENLSRPMSTSKVIGREGGAVRLRGCVADFPENTIDENHIITLTTRTKGTEIPEEYEAISPELQCSTSSEVEFHRLVTMKLPLYRRNVKGHATILCKKTAREEWKELEGECLEENGAVIFKVSHFSLLRAVLRAIFGSTTLAVNYLYYKPATAQLYGLVCLDDEGIIESSTGRLEKMDYKSLIEIPDKVTLENGEKIGYSLLVTSPPGHRVEPVGKVEYTAEDVYQSKCLSRKFIIAPIPGRRSDVILEYTLEKPNSPAQPSSLGLTELRDSRSLEEIRDPTGRVLHETVICSSEDDYRKHLRDPNIYQITPDRQKGNVLIINNDFQGTRGGSDKDVENMKKLWRSLGFNVKNKANLSDIDMLGSCGEFSKDARDVSAIVTIIMSHGGKEDGEEYFLGNNGVKVLVCDIVDIFSSSASPHLDGIPKLFLFQACRGKKGDYAWHEVQSDANPERQQQLQSPNRADVLISFPTQSGYKALRDLNSGSWLMNAIANIFTQHAHDRHVMDMLTMVNREVGSKITDTRRVQISNQENYFRKDLFLFPGWPKENI